MAAQTAEKRPLGALGRMSLVAAIHVAVLFVIANGLGIVPSIPIESMIGTIENDPVRPQPVDPPPLEPTLERTPITAIPEPDPLPIPADPTEGAIDVPLRPIEQIQNIGGSAVVEPQITGARLDPRRPLSQPIYPSQLIRENAQGYVDVEVLVQPDGRVGDARIVKTSGYDAFDRNTLDEAKRRWRLTPATRDGVAIPQWYRLRVVFKLKDQ